MYRYHKYLKTQEERSGKPNVILQKILNEETSVLRVFPNNILPTGAEHTDEFVTKKSLDFLLQKYTSERQYVEPFC